VAGHCKRSSSTRWLLIAAGERVDVVLSAATVEYTLRVVDQSSFVGVAFTLAYLENPDSIFHFAAGESYQEENIGPLAGALTLKLGAAVAARVELIVWEA
jgi:hypothetical protein